jgi:hypothetical protein
VPGIGSGGKRQHRRASSVATRTFKPFWPLCPCPLFTSDVQAHRLCRNIHRCMHVHTFRDSRRHQDGAMFATAVFHDRKTSLAYGAVSAIACLSYCPADWLRSLLPQTSLVQGIAYQTSNISQSPVATRPTKIPRPTRSLCLRGCTR